MVLHSAYYTAFMGPAARKPVKKGFVLCDRQSQAARRANCLTAKAQIMREASGPCGSL